MFWNDLFEILPFLRLGILIWMAMFLLGGEASLKLVLPRFWYTGNIFYIFWEAFSFDDLRCWYKDGFCFSKVSDIFMMIVCLFFSAQFHGLEKYCRGRYPKQPTTWDVIPWCSKYLFRRYLDPKNLSKIHPQKGLGTLGFWNPRNNMVDIFTIYQLLQPREDFWTNNSTSLVPKKQPPF